MDPTTLKMYDQEVEGNDHVFSCIFNAIHKIQKRIKNGFRCYYHDDDHNHDDDTNNIITAANAITSLSSLEIGRYLCINMINYLGYQIGCLFFHIEYHHTNTMNDAQVLL